MVVRTWPRSAPRHPPALPLLCFSCYQQLLGRHSAAVANETSDLLPAFSHPLSRPGAPPRLPLSLLSLCIRNLRPARPPPPPLSIYCPLYLLRLCDAAASSLCKNIGNFTLGLLAQPVFFKKFFWSSPAVRGANQPGRRHMCRDSRAPDNGGDISAAI